MVFASFATLLLLVGSMIASSDAVNCLDVTTAKWRSLPNGGYGTQSVNFKWTVNDTSISIFMTATSNDTKQAPQWIGFGFSESGGMVGSDIVTVTYDRATGTAGVQDRFVLWSPNGMPWPTQDVRNDWTLRCYSSDAKSLTAVVTRLLDTGDTQDRAVKAEPIPVIYGWGPTTSVQYHGAYRGGTTVYFLGEQSTFVIPPDADGSMLLSYTPPWTLTGTRTQYVCQVFDMGNADRHVIAIEAQYIDKPYYPYVHHMLVHSCGSDLALLHQQFLFDFKPYPCQAGATMTIGLKIIPIEGGIDAEGKSPLITCDILMFGAAEGTAVVSYPPDVGILMGKHSRYVVLETHLDNPMHLKNVDITDVVKLYTTTKLRKYNGGTMIVGDPLVMFKDIAPNSSVIRKGTCTSACTDLMGGPIMVYSSLLHMHKYGREIWTTMKSKETGNTSVVDFREFWDFGFQLQIPKQFTINRGDELTVHCRFNTGTTKEAVAFGSGSDNEMCMDFLSFYPAENAFKICGYGSLGTVCGGTMGTAIRNIYEPNPLPDDVGMGIPVFGIIPETPAPTQNVTRTPAPTQKSGAMGTTVLGMVMTGALFSILF